MHSQGKARLAIDIGGTFTDAAIALPGSSQGFVTAKCPTTPDKPVEGAMAGVALALERANLTPADIGSFIHGTTLATNALIEQKGARVGVITTEGFRDIPEIVYERVTINMTETSTSQIFLCRGSAALTCRNACR